MSKHNYILAVVMAGVGAFVLVVASGFPPGEHGTMSPAFWPGALALILMALALLLVVNTIRHGDDSADIRFFATAGQKKVWKATALLVGYLIAIRIAGFYLSNIVFVPALSFMLGERDWNRLLVFDLCANASVYILFTMLLRIRLPGPIFL